MALPSKKQLSAEHFKARIAAIQTEQRARTVAAIRHHIEQEVRRGYSLDVAGDIVLERLIEGRAPADHVTFARKILLESGWTPKRERA